MRIFPILLFLTCISFFASAQKTKSQLEKEKKENERKIEQTQKILQETQSRKVASIGQLNALKQQISDTEKLINSISSEVDMLNGEMTEIEIIANSMQNDLENLKKEYALMVYTASKFHNNYNALYFVFSAKTFNQFFRRINYLSQYSRERKEQVEQIKKVQSSLLDQKERIKNKKQEKDLLLVSQQRQNNSLIILTQEKNRIIGELNSKEKELNKEIVERKATLAQLEKMISSVIESEMKKASKATSSSKVTANPEAELLSNSFEGNRSKFFWPVASGFVSQKFGVQEHAVIKGVKIDNTGIDIQTNKGEPVRAIFDGKIEYVGFIPGFGNTVMISHGEYYTVYSKLSKVSVKKDERIKTKEVIGEVLTDKNGISEVHFEIWKNMIKLDPEAWLYDKK